MGATSQEKKEFQNTQQGNFVTGINKNFSIMINSSQELIGKDENKENSNKSGIINSSQELIGFKDKDKDKNKDNSNKKVIVVPKLDINTFDRGME